MSQLSSHVWTIRAAQIAVSLSTPLTLIQYVAGTAIPTEILGFSVSQGASTTSAMERVRLGKVSVAGTGGVAGSVGSNIFRWDSPDDAFKGQLGAALTAVNLAVEPTFTDLPRELDFNVLNGYECWFQRPYFVPAAGMVGLRLAGLVAGTWDAELFVREISG